MFEVLVLLEEKAQLIGHVSQRIDVASGKGEFSKQVVVGLRQSDFVKP